MDDSILWFLGVTRKFDSIVKKHYNLRMQSLGVMALIIISLFTACSPKPSGSSSDSSAYALSLQFTRVNSGTYNPFRVTATLTKGGVTLAGQTLSTTIPKGSVSAITDNGDGTYTFTVTPSSTGTYPVTVSFGDTSITRKAVVFDSYKSGVGQPLAVPGDYVNTAGYEDGATITPDGQYLFIQYGPIYFSGLFNFTTICSSGSYTAGYDLNTCNGRTNSSLVFNTIGPYVGPYRPNFPTGGIDSGTLHHLPSLVIAGVANGIVGFPTVFYGFKKQADGTFAEPFKVAFNDARGLNGPFGLSFRVNSDNTATFVVAWNNYFNDLGGDGKPDIYNGTLTLGQDKNLGDVVYSGETYSSITPYITPVGFSSHAGVQGNPHLYYNNAGTIQSVWTDDEQVSHDLSVYRLTSGTFPSGTWVKDTLPSPINTAGHESQPFFTGSELILTRDSKIVSHAYQPTNGSCASGFTSANCWGSETVLIGANGHTSVGEIYGVGEPTVATVDGKRYLYFVYVEARANSAITGIIDWNLDVAFVEIP